MFRVYVRRMSELLHVACQQEIEWLYLVGIFFPSVESCQGFHLSRAFDRDVLVCVRYSWLCLQNAKIKTVRRMTQNMAMAPMA